MIQFWMWISTFFIGNLITFAILIRAIKSNRLLEKELKQSRENEISISIVIATVTQWGFTTPLAERVIQLLNEKEVLLDELNNAEQHNNDLEERIEEMNPIYDNAEYNIIRIAELGEELEELRNNP